MLKINLYTILLVFFILILTSCQTGNMNENYIASASSNSENVDYNPDGGNVVGDSEGEGNFDNNEYNQDSTNGYNPNDIENIFVDVNESNNENESNDIGELDNISSNMVELDFNTTVLNVTTETSGGNTYVTTFYHAQISYETYNFIIQTGFSNNQKFCTGDECSHSMNGFIPLIGQNVHITGVLNTETGELTVDSIVPLN